MSTTHEVISAFLDNESFDPEALAGALEDPAGRKLLIDLITMRRLVQPNEALPAVTPPTPVWRPTWRVAAAAAGLSVAVGGGYFAGERRAATPMTDAPAPSRVVQAVPFTPEGGVR